MSKRLEDAHRLLDEGTPVERLAGEDLTEEALDDLYDAVILGGDIGGGRGYHGWWDNKPHQILHRLLLRLTRAEHEVPGRCVDEHAADVHAWEVPLGLHEDDEL